jgi:hypothetical protein
MPVALKSPRGWGLGTLFVLGVAILASARGGGFAAASKEEEPRPAVMEYTQQEVESALLVQTLNDLGKQSWDVFQVIPVWTLKNQNGEAEMTPKAYQVLGRRPSATAK